MNIRDVYADHTFKQCVINDKKAYWINTRSHNILFSGILSSNFIETTAVSSAFVTENLFFFFSNTPCRQTPLTLPKRDVSFFGSDI